MSTASKRSLFPAGDTADVYPLLSSRERLSPWLLYLKALCSNRIRSLSLFPPVTNVPPMPKFSSSTTIAEKLMYIIVKVDWITRVNMMLVNSSHTLQTQQVWRLQESLHLRCHARFFPKHMRLPLPKVQSHLFISTSFCLSLDSHRSGFHSSGCSKTSPWRCRHQANPLIRTPPGIPL
jgi:hypothetical protein